MGVNIRFAIVPSLGKGRRLGRPAIFILKLRIWALPSPSRTLRLGSVFLRARLFASLPDRPSRLRRGVGRQFALAHPPVHLTRGRRDSIQSRVSSLANRYPKQINQDFFFDFSTLQPFNHSTFQLSLCHCSLGCPPTEAAFLQVNLLGGHPGGGSERPARDWHLSVMLGHAPGWSEGDDPWKYPTG